MFDDSYPLFQGPRDKYHASRQLDGVSCTFVCRYGVCSASDQNGLSLQNINLFTREIGKFIQGGYLSGVMTVVDGSGTECANIINSILYDNEDDVKEGRVHLDDDQKLFFQTFDLVQFQTFDLVQFQTFDLVQFQTPAEAWSDRQNALREFYDSVFRTESPLARHIHIIQQYTHDFFEGLHHWAVAKGWKGIVYRHKDHCITRKIADEDDFQLTAVACEPSSLKFRIEYKGCPVWVEKGLSRHQRTVFTRDSTLLG
jgi:hypothetical protein